VQVTERFHPVTLAGLKHVNGVGVVLAAELVQDVDDLSREREAVPLLRFPCSRVWPGICVWLPAELLVKASGAAVADVHQKLRVGEAVCG
jgi:hypothetical protein